MFAKGLPVHITGGMELHVKMLVDGLIKRGHEVAIITTKHPGGIKIEEHEMLNIYYVGNKPLTYTKKFYKDSAKLFEQLDYIMNFDVVHSQSGSGFGFTKFSQRKIPFVTTLHGTAKNEIKSSLNTKTIRGSLRALHLFVNDGIHSKIANEILTKSDKIISVSNELNEDVQKQYNIPSGNLVTIPNGIDIDRFKLISAEDLKEKLNIKTETVILSVGRIDEQKGFQLLIKALPKILDKFDVKLVIVGTGPYLRSLKSMAEKRGLQDRVVFAGRVSDEDLPKYYNLADVFAFPTLRLEGLPYVIPEAMSCGRPVISSRIGGIPTAIESGRDGILIEPGNLEELTKNILYLLGDEEFAKELGMKAREKVVREFSLDKMVEDTIKVYEDVINNSV
jgi:glycosyltransferase involved in cell wall biosynthesis